MLLLNREQPMPAPETMLDVYLHLAAASEEQRKPLERDKLLVLAAYLADHAGHTSIAEDCRIRILARNPNHIFKHFADVHEALRSDDVLHYTRQIMRIYPFEKAEYLLHKFRASGYSGLHGYEGELAKSATAKRPKSPSKMRRRKRRKTTGSQSDQLVPRAALQRAFDAVEARSVQSAPRKRRVPASVDPTEPATARRALTLSAALSWIVLTLAIGIAIGGATVWWLLPGP